MNTPVFSSVVIMCVSCSLNSVILFHYFDWMMDWLTWEKFNFLSIMLFANERKWQKINVFLLLQCKNHFKHFTFHEKPTRVWIAHKLYPEFIHFCCSNWASARFSFRNSSVLFHILHPNRYVFVKQLSHFLSSCLALATSHGFPLFSVNYISTGMIEMVLHLNCFSWNFCAGKFWFCGWISSTKTILRTVQWYYGWNDLDTLPVKNCM